MDFKTLDRAPFLEILKNHEWVEGKRIPVLLASYRHVIVVACSQSGRNKAQFSNGEFPYFAHVALASRKLDFIENGCMIVPVLPDGRVIMIIEQRPPTATRAEQNRRLELKNEDLQLGPDDSVEFPGGAIEIGENIVVGSLRELVEESGVPNQPVTLYLAKYPCNNWMELALKTFYGFALLTKNEFSPKTTDEGGELRVLAITPEEVDTNIDNGVINSAMVMVNWNFYHAVTNRGLPQNINFHIINTNLK